MKRAIKFKIGALGFFSVGTLVASFTIAFLPIKVHPIKLQKLYLYNKDSVLVHGDFTKGNTDPLPTYRNLATGDVPYVLLDDFIATSDISEGLSVSRTGEGTYSIIKRNSNAFAANSSEAFVMNINTNDDTVTILDFDSLIKPIDGANNGVPGDFCDIADAYLRTDYLVHSSTSTVQVGTPKTEIYDLKKYSIDLISYEDNCYVPIQFFANLVYRTRNLDIIYNGIDFYMMDKIDLTRFGTVSSYYSSDYSFIFTGYHFRKATPVDPDETHRFVYIDRRWSYFYVFSFKNNGTACVNWIHKYDDSVNSSDINYTFNWSKDSNGIYVNYFNNALASDCGTFKIATTKGYYRIGNRSQSVAKFTYNLLKFQFDELYGLQKELHSRYNVKNFDDLVRSKKLNEDLLSTNSQTYDLALANLIEGVIDDYHSFVSVPSVYTGPNVNWAKTHLGERSSRISNLQTKYIDDRLAYQNPGATTYPDNTQPDEYGQCLLIKDKTAIIRFSAFLHDNTYISRSASYNNYSAFLKNIFTISTALGFDYCFDQIKRNSNIKYVILDLTSNMGGMPVTLPYLAAHFTRDPTLIIQDVKLGVTREYHYKVDLNRDYTYGGAGDTYADDYSFALLTSDASFSCGSALPTMAKLAGVPVIGMKTAGGTCYPARFSDGSGSVYMTSTSMQISYYVNKNLQHNDNGIEPDLVVNFADWFDISRLQTIMETYYPNN